MLTSQPPEEVKLRKLKANVCEQADSTRSKNLKLIGIPEEDESGAEKILLEIITENSPQFESKPLM